jgi:hypothetical protein
MIRRRFELCAARGGLALLLLSLACASQQTVVVWDKAGASEAEFAAAREACKDEPGADQVQIGRDRVEGELRANAFVRCMEAKGFTWKTELQPRG